MNFNRARETRKCLPVPRLQHILFTSFLSSNLVSIWGWIMLSFLMCFLEFTISRTHLKKPRNFNTFPV